MSVNKKILFYSLLLLSPSCLWALTVGSTTAVSRQTSVQFPANDTDNTMSGFATFESGFTLEDNTTTCSYDSHFPVSGALNFKGGALYLLRDMRLYDGAYIFKGGSILGGGHTVSIAPDVSLFRWPSQVSDFTLIDTIFPSAGIFSCDWSPDNNYLAVGYADGAGTDLNIYYFDESTLTLTASVELGNDGYSVKWHPSLSYLAVGRDGSGGNDLYIYQHDVSAGTFLQTDALDLASDARGVGWAASGVYLGVGTSDSYKIHVYSFNSGNGTMSEAAQVTLPNTRKLEKGDSLSWDSTESYIAVGLEYHASYAQSVYIYHFNGSALTQKTSLDFSTAVYATVWHPTEPLLAVGIGGGTERLRIYSFDYATETLTEKTEARVGEVKNVYSLDWDSTGSFLLVGVDDGVGAEMRIYFFNKNTYELELLDQKDFSLEARAVSLRPNCKHIAAGISNAGTPELKVYRTDGGDRSWNIVDTSIDLQTGLQLSSSMTFAGTCFINGNDNDVMFGENTTIAIASGAYLHLSNVRLVGLSGEQLKCLDASSSLVLHNVRVIQSGNSDFTQGSLDISGNVYISGQGSFKFSSDQFLTIAKHSSLFVDTAMTFDYSPSAQSANHLIFSDETSLLHLNNAMLNSTKGLNLKKGTLIVEGTSFVANAGTTQSEGIIFGDGVSSVHDMHVDVLPSGSLEVLSGYVVYKNLS